MHHLVVAASCWSRMFGWRLCFLLLSRVRWSFCSVVVIAADWRVHCWTGCSSDSGCSSLGLQLWAESFARLDPCSCVERLCSHWCFHLPLISFGHSLKHLYCDSFYCRTDFLIGQMVDSFMIWTTSFVAVGLILSWYFYNLHTAAFHLRFNMPYITIHLDYLRRLGLVLVTVDRLLLDSRWVTDALSWPGSTSCPPNSYFGWVSLRWPSLRH